VCQKKKKTNNNGAKMKSLYELIIRKRPDGYLIDMLQYTKHSAYSFEYVAATDSMNAEINAMLIEVLLA